MAQRNKPIGRKWWFAGLFVVVVGMNGFAYATVPAYRAFCQQFGFAGTPLVATVAPADDEVVDREITVRFNADISPALDWRFKPVQRSVKLKVGETGLAFFESHNRSDQTLTGTATFNVTPLKAAPYFVKIQCFCFDEQTLDADQRADMPVTFFVDPEIMNDRNIDDVTTITLSYHFFPVDDPAPTAETQTAAAAN